MACYHPMQGYRSAEVTKNGKRKIVFSPQKGYIDLPVKVACGQCIGCRLERSRQWAIRCVNEASLYRGNCFITLTYSDEYLPQNKSLDKRDFQLFMKRLRKEFSSERIRYFHCGEYGCSCKVCGLSAKLCRRVGCGSFVEGLGRPHYHALFFFMFISSLK